MLKTIIKASLLLILMTVLTGIIYPLLITGVSESIFPDQADGSLVYIKGQAVGSILLGQNFSQPQYFHGRPSAAGDSYDAMSSSGSNLGPTSRKLLSLITQRVHTVREEDLVAADLKIPSDLVTASASGLDPHISPASAELQVNRVANVRKISPDEVRKLVAQCTENPVFVWFGEPRVNVLELNLKLDGLK